MDGNVSTDLSSADADTPSGSWPTVTGTPAEVTSSPQFRLPVVLLLGLPLSLLCFCLVVRIEQIDQVGMPTGIVPYFHVIAVLSLIVSANVAWRRWIGPRSALGAGEMLCLYSMMAVASAFASWEALGTIIPSIAYPGVYRFRGHMDTRWMEAVKVHLPLWAVVQDPAAANAILQGGAWGAIWHAWLPPLLTWGIVLSILFVTYMAVSRLLFERWAHNEKLAFPLMRLPLELTNGNTTLWRSRLFWGFFAVVAALDLWNGLHLFFPSVPLPVQKVIWLNTDPGNTAWSALGSVPLTFHPFLYGLAFLLPTDLLLSVVFFYTVALMQLYICGSLNLAQGSPWQFGGNMPGLHEQNFGAIITMSVMWLWNTRVHLGERFREAIARGGEPRRDYVIASLGLLLLGAGLVVLGLAPWAALLAVGMILLLSVFVTRLRAEIGLPLHNLQFLGPGGPLTAFFGSRTFDPRGLEALTTVYSITRSQQGNEMPHQMEALYLSERTNTRRSYGIAIAVTGIVTAMVGPWLFLALVSGHGLENMPGGRYNPIGENGWSALGSTLRDMPGVDTRTILQMGTGSLVTMLLMVLRRGWLGFPLHPIGYAICGSWEIEFIVVPFFCAWLVKSLVLRYGGLSTYRIAVNGALGLVCGDFAMGGIWSLVGLIGHVHTYQIWLF